MTVGLRELNGDRAQRRGWLVGRKDRAVGAEAPTEESAWKFEGLVSRVNKVPIEFPSTVEPGSQVWFTAFWFNARRYAVGSQGPVSFLTSPQWTPPGYPEHVLRPPGNGERSRVTVMGPGVTPVVQWEGPALGLYDPQQDAEAITERFFADSEWLAKRLAVTAQ